MMSIIYQNCNHNALTLIKVTSTRNFKTDFLEIQKKRKLEQYGNKATAYRVLVKFQRNTEHARKVYCSQCSGHKLKGQGHNRSMSQ